MELDSVTMQHISWTSVHSQCWTAMHKRLLQHWLQTQALRWAWCCGTHCITPICRHMFSPLKDLTFLQAENPLSKNPSMLLSQETRPRRTGVSYARGTQARAPGQYHCALCWHTNCLRLLQYCWPCWGFDHWSRAKAWINGTVSTTDSTWTVPQYAVLMHQLP